MKQLFILFLGAFASLIYFLLYRFLGPWDYSIDVIMAGILLFLLGIPHGAGDHLVEAKIRKLSGKKFSILHFIVQYLGIMGLYAICWWLSPVISFIIFIITSIFHFGDLEDINPSNLPFTLIDYGQLVARGMGILGVILSSHWSEVVPIVNQMGIPIVNQIADFYLPFSFFSYTLGFKKKNVAQFINTFLTLALGVFIPLIPAFVLFFTLCHSIYSLQVMKNRLALNVLELYKNLFPFTLGALSLFLIYIFLVYNDLQLFSLFIFLSVITLPHFIIMHKLIKLKSE